MNLQWLKSHDIFFSSQKDTVVAPTFKNVRNSTQKITKTHYVFDMDDTLVDSYEFNQQLFVDTFMPYLDLTITETDRFLRELHYASKGASMRQQFEVVINHFSLNLNPTELVKDNELLHIQHVDKIKFFDAAVDVINVLRSAHKKVSICTNRQTTSSMKILTNNGLNDSFDYIVSCSDAGHEKPDPYCLLDIIEKSGEPKEEFIYFGDSKTDLQFANNAGIDSVIVDHYLNEKKYYKMLLQSFM